MDPDALARLLEPEGQQLLERAGDAPADPLAASAWLRREAPQARTDLVAAALTQAQLRRRAEAKFGPLARRMYFTPEGLEQATRLPVGRHRAARVAAGSAGSVSVVDLGCGIGGDLVALAEAGATVVGVDLDPLRVAVARANLAALDLGGAVSVADATGVDTSPFAVAYADPARRTSRGRSFDVDAWSPPWSFVEELMQRASCVKVAPGIPHERVPEGVEAEWVSDRGEVKEAALWSSWLATVRRRATVLGEGGLATLTDQDDPGRKSVAVGPASAYLFEPDGAVIRAGLVTAVAARVGGHLLDEHIAYLSGPEPVLTPFARAYEVLEELPHREKALRAALRERGVGRLTVKKRGVSAEPEELRRRMQLRGDNEATIVLTRASGRGVCLSVRPLATAAG